MLNATAILYQLNRNVVIVPFVERNLGTNSYDVTLGEWYYRQQKPKSPTLHVYNIYSEGDVRAVWGNPQQAGEAFDTLPAYASIDGIFEDDKVIMLQPGETVLCHTQEFIGARGDVTTKMQARSSIGRSDITVCRCAGSGDIGYINRWTMEVTNNSRYYHIPLVVGRRVAQMMFFRTEGRPGMMPTKAHETGLEYSKTGKYQTFDSFDDVEVMMAKWEPSMMLPKLHLDREVKERAAD